MTDDIQPRKAGRYDFKTFTPPADVSLVQQSTPELGSFPVHLADLPNVGNYQFSASAMTSTSGGAIIAYFSEQEFTRLIEVINEYENESDDPMPITKADDKFEIRTTTGEHHLLPHLSTAHGTFWALDTDGGTRDFELSEGQWFDDGGFGQDLTEIHTDRNVGRTFDRSWTVRRDDDQFVTRTVTWFVEAYKDDSESLDANDEGENVTTFSVLCQTRDTVSPTLHGDDVDELEDMLAEDHLESERAFETLGEAEKFAAARARGASEYFHVRGWDGYGA
jgi:hypothetical protein